MYKNEKNKNKNKTKKKESFLEDDFMYHYLPTLNASFFRPLSGRTSY